MEEFVKSAKIMIKINSCIDGGVSIIRCKTCPLFFYNNAFEKETTDYMTVCANTPSFKKSSKKIHWLKHWLDKYGDKKQLEFDF